MNTNNETVATETAGKVRGRPINPNATRVLRVNPATGAVYGKGRITEGTKVIEVVVHRKVNSINYVHGQTPVVSQAEVEFHANHKAKQVLVAKPVAQVIVTESQPVIPDAIVSPAPLAA